MSTLTSMPAPARMTYNARYMSWFTSKRGVMSKGSYRRHPSPPSSMRFHTARPEPRIFPSLNATPVDVWPKGQYARARASDAKPVEVRHWRAYADWGVGNGGMPERKEVFLGLNEGGMCACAQLCFRIVDLVEDDLVWRGTY